MNTYVLRYRLLAKSKDGKIADSIENDFISFRESNRNTIKEILSLPISEKYQIIVDGTNGVTIVDGSEPFEYKRDSKEIDDRLAVSLGYVFLDLRDVSSDLYNKLFTQFVEENGNVQEEQLIDFALRVVESILTRGAASGSVEGASTRICAKSYMPGANKYLDYGEYTNYFTFDLKDGIWKDSIRALNPGEGNYMLDEKIDELDKEYILKYVVPAFYFSLIFAKTFIPGVRNFFNYDLELA